MKIGFVGARGIPHGYSSTEQIALNVGLRLVERGHEFTVYCRSHLFQDRAPRYKGIRRVFLPTMEHKILGQLFHGFIAGSHSLFCDYDLVHFQCLTNAFQAVLPWLIRRNTVINVDGQEWENPKWPKTLRHVFFKSAAWVALRISREFITDAQGMYDIYMDRYGRKSTVIEYGADLVQPEHPEVLNVYGLRPRQYFFIAARLIASNQIALLVDAFNKSNSKRILAIAGGGHGNSLYYQQMCARAGDRVKFLGLISDQSHMNELYANAYAYLHGASLGGVNSALLRPLGAGCPALAYDTPFNREVLQMADGSLCGRLWRNEEEVARGLAELEGDPSLVDRLAQASVLQIRRNFTWDLVADQYEMFYRGIIERWSPELIRSRVAAQKERYAQAGSMKS